MVKYLLFLFLLLITAACSSDEQATASSHSAETDAQITVSAAAAEKSNQPPAYRLVFFLNPDGGPCRMQNAILDGMANELDGKVEIRYVQTTVPGDRDLFYHYGIRGLPTLLLADASGKEIKRMAPGVKSTDDIRLLIQSIPQS